MGDTVILDLLSNGSFMGTTDDGMLSPAVHMEDGRYHVPGSLVPTPMSIVRKALKSCEGMYCERRKKFESHSGGNVTALCQWEVL
jgi:hypothetical protein